jgi:hypothetical protein
MNFIENILYSFLELAPRAIGIRLRHVWVREENQDTSFEVTFNGRDNFDTLKGLITHALTQRGRPNTVVNRIYLSTANGEMNRGAALEGFYAIINNIQGNSYDHPLWFTILDPVPEHGSRARTVWVRQNGDHTPHRPFQVSFHAEDNIDTFMGLLSVTLSQRLRPYTAVDRIFPSNANGEMNTDVSIEGFEFVISYIEGNSYNHPLWFTILEPFHILPAGWLSAWFQQDGYPPFQVAFRPFDNIDNVKELIAVALYRRRRTGHTEVCNVYMSDANGHLNRAGLIAVDDLVANHLEGNSPNHPLWFTITQSLAQAIVVRNGNGGSRTTSTSSGSQHFLEALSEPESLH